MRKEVIENNLIVKTTFEFSLAIIDYCELLEGKRRFVIANHLLKAGTIIGHIFWEAQNAESKNDFIHKFKIAAKEMDETEYWLLLCKNSKKYPDVELLLEKIESISKIINKIIASSKKSANSLIN